MPGMSTTIPPWCATTQLRAGQTAVLEKVVVLFTSRDAAEPLAAAQARLAQLPLPAWDALWPQQQRAWDENWQACDISIEGDDEAQIALRFSLFQLLVAAPQHDEHVSIGAKTLSGYGYRGHSFWDTEVFMLPFLPTPARLSPATCCLTASITCPARATRPRPAGSRAPSTPGRAPAAAKRSPPPGCPISPTPPKWCASGPATSRSTSPPCLPGIRPVLDRHRR